MLSPSIAQGQNHPLVAASWTWNGTWEDAFYGDGNNLWGFGWHQYNNPNCPNNNWITVPGQVSPPAYGLSTPPSWPEVWYVGADHKLYIAYANNWAECINNWWTKPAGNPPGGADLSGAPSASSDPSKYLGGMVPDVNNELWEYTYNFNTGLWGWVDQGQLPEAPDPVHGDISYVHNSQGAQGPLVAVSYVGKSGHLWVIQFTVESGATVRTGQPYDLAAPAYGPWAGGPGLYVTNWDFGGLIAANENNPPPGTNPYVEVYAFIPNSSGPGWQLVDLANATSQGCLAGSGGSMSTVGWIEPDGERNVLGGVMRCRNAQNYGTHWFAFYTTDTWTWQFQNDQFVNGNYPGDDTTPPYAFINAMTTAQSGGGTSGDIAFIVGVAYANSGGAAYPAEDDYIDCPSNNPNCGYEGWTPVRWDGPPANAPPML